MTKRNTFIRSLHDIGLAAWFGGALMGAVGLNGATAAATPSSERLRLSSLGWSRWAPLQLAAIAVHGVGGVGLIASNKGRLLVQPESRANTVVKIVVTALAGASTLYSGILGKTIHDHQDEPTDGVTEPSPESSDALSTAQDRQRILQWITPALTLVMIVLAAQQGEQQRPIKGLLKSAVKKLR
ncbi:hypothetical protein [Lacisediminihabitans sp. H27-G8]|uniref:hypothetical protein n=1 Tax=Lacisediminihabitans sp. H27-G8 TaxID=3111909 RepID=UPI0038FC9080